VPWAELLTLMLPLMLPGGESSLAPPLTA
jgi:hypothetical protein